MDPALLRLLRLLYAPDDGTGGGGTPPPADPPADPPPPAADDKGFPADTPIAEMSVEQREAYWKHQARKHEQAWKDKAGDLTPEQVDQLRQAAAELEQFKRQNLSDQERAIADARDQAAAEAREQARREIGGELVAARIEAAAAGRLTGEQLEALVDSIDRTKYLADDGKVDADKVKALVDRLAPPAGDNDKHRRFPDLGQGRRESKPATSVAAGRELFEARRSKAS